MKWFLLCTLGLMSPIVFASPAEVLIIRHAEKPEDGPNLSPEGARHAEDLVDYFTTCDGLLKDGKLDVIIAMTPHREGASTRSIETIRPLAEKLGLHPNVTYTREDWARMVKDLMENRAYKGKTVLICWQHETIPDIAKALGVAKPLASWDREDYDSLYRIEFKNNGAVKSFAIVKQNIPSRESL